MEGVDAEEGRDLAGFVEFLNLTNEREEQADDVVDFGTVAIAEGGEVVAE